MHSYLHLFICNQTIFHIEEHMIYELGFHANPFQVNKNILNFTWQEIVITPPTLHQANQLLYTLHGAPLWMSIINIPASIKKDSYIIRLSKHQTLHDMTIEDEITTYESETTHQSAKMKKIMDIITKISSVDSTVLLLGETGVGKTWLAKYIHQSSTRKDKPFLSINCSTLPDSLIESELFGYEAGTFTGGNRKGKKGLLESANNGIVFLDEVGELPLAVQAKLLEVLQDGTFRKIGGEKNIQVDVRFIAATNRNLKKMVEFKEFREDLYYRLHVVPITIPSLQERQEEIIPLAHQFLNKLNNKYNRNTILHNNMTQQLLTYHWPGNIRELENAIEQYVVTQTFPKLFPNTDHKTSSLTNGDTFPSLKKAKNNFEKQLILQAYEKLGTTYKVADALQVDQSTIAKKLKQYRKEKEVNK